MAIYKIVYELDRNKWSDFVYNHPNGNIFQTPEMFEVYKNTKCWEPIFLAVTDANESDNLLGVLLCVTQREFGGIFGEFSARTIIWGGPLIKLAEASEQIVKFLLKALDKHIGKKTVYTQFRNLFDLSDSKKYFITNSYSYEEHLDFICDLTMGEDNLWEKLFPARRNEIRKAERQGLEVRLIDNIADLKDSYHILKEVYSRIKIPLADESLFDSAFRILFPKNMLKVFVAKYNNKIIGVLYLLVYREKTYVWYAGSLSEYLNKHPNDILYWEAMRWGCRSNYKIFDFGGAGRPDEEYGVREFKKQFGGEMVNYGRFTKAYRPIIMRIVNAGILLLRKI